MKRKREVRPLTREDLDALAYLEECVWKLKGIEAAPRETLFEWIEKGILIGCLEDGALVGYAYAEQVAFSPVPPYSAEILRSLEDYKLSARDPLGNALHGVSMAVTRPGAGALLLEALLGEARRLKLSYFVSLARLAGFGRFVEENSLERSGHAAACYAIQAVSAVSPALVGPPLSFLTLPNGFPAISRKDPVVSRFARIGKELWGVVETSFKDPESLGYSALLVLPL